MSELKLCQGSKCHQYQTKDRLKGMKDNKTYQTRRRSGFYFGRLTEPKHLNEHNAWQKTYDWNSNDETLYVYRNGITKEERPLTREQYRDSNYTLNER
jgi:hypothetical protein